jgi:hypothetical protein
MVSLKSITDKAKDLIGQRGGTESLKEDAGELKDIATGEGSITDKAKAAAEAVKDPGAEGPEGEAKAEAGEPKAERHDGGERHRRREDRP